MFKICIHIKKVRHKIEWIRDSATYSPRDFALSVADRDNVKK